jgi:hypothetical protein
MVLIAQFNQGYIKLISAETSTNLSFVFLFLSDYSRQKFSSRPGHYISNHLQVRVKPNREALK